jgi:hypothetical protein
MLRSLSIKLISSQQREMVQHVRALMPHNQSESKNTRLSTTLSIGTKENFPENNIITLLRSLHHTSTLYESNWSQINHN